MMKYAVVMTGVMVLAVFGSQQGRDGADREASALLNVPSGPASKTASFTEEVARDRVFLQNLIAQEKE